MKKRNIQRWEYRFLEFQKSLKNLKKAVAIKSPDDIYRAGILHLFEVSFELSWKTLKDYLEFLGYIINSPKQVLIHAFKDGIISDGHSWYDALEKRNLIAHTYNEEEVIEIETLIRSKFLNLLKELEKYLKKCK